IPHSTPVDTIPTASLTLIGSGTGTVGGDLTSSTIPVTATLADAVGTELVVEYHIDGSPTAPFFPGGNTSAETHPSFISAADCGILEPTPMADIGFPDAHEIIVVNLGDGGPPPPTGCAAPSDLPWASVSQSAGTTAPGASSDVTVTFDSTGRAVGSYDGLLCVASNDPVTPLVEVPVSLTVTAGGGGGGDDFDNTEVVPVPDDGYDGTTGSMACTDIDTSSIDPSATVTGVTVDTKITHTWIGDVTTKLVSPDGSVLTLLSRPGFVEPADDGQGCCGDSSEMAATSPLTFDDASANDAESMGAGLPGSTDVVCQDDGICDFFPNPGAAATPPASFADLAGETASGTWTLCVG